jgi:dihydrofolate synthase/folylpolyglutamate synthase
MEVVQDAPLVIFDGAHNGAGMAALADSLPEVTAGRPLTAVISILGDKDADAMLGALLPGVENVVFTRTGNPRALSPETLVDLSGRDDAAIVEEPKAALQRAKELAGTDGAVLATGSIYLIADLVREAGMARASML